MNVEGYLEHLRKTWLAVVLLASTLVVGIGDDASRFSRAADQLKSLAESTKDWASYWTVWDAVDKAASNSGIYVNLSSRRSELGRSTDAFGAIPHAHRFQFDKEVVVRYHGSDYPIEIQVEVEVPPAYVPKILHHTRGNWLGPAEFERFWRALLEELRIVSEIETENADVTLSVTSGGLSEDLMKSNLERAVQEGLRASGQILLSSADERSIAELVDTDPKYKGRYGGAYVLDARITVPVHLKSQKPPILLCDLFEQFRQFGCGSFGETFPDLAYVAKEYPEGLSVEAAQKLLARDETRTPGEIKLLGIPVPRKKVIIAGLLMLLCSTLYLSALLRNLHRVVQGLSEVPSSPPVPWIGLFTGPLPAGLWLLSAWFLPLAAASSLVKAGWQSELKYVALAGAVAVAVSTTLTVIYSSKLHMVWYGDESGSKERVPFNEEPVRRQEQPNMTMQQTPLRAAADLTVRPNTDHGGKDLGVE